MKVNLFSALLACGLLAACNQPVTTPTPSPEPVTSPTVPQPGEEPTTALRCLELTLDAPATVAPGEGTLTLTATNGCDEVVEARLAGTPAFTFYLTAAGGQEVWVYPDGTQLDDIRRHDVAPGEAITYTTEWTGGYDERDGTVPAGTYSLHGTLELVKNLSTPEFGTLETPPQPLTVLSGGEASAR